jgi:outer membrane protein assembly factor BamB
MFKRKLLTLVASLALLVAAIGAGPVSATNYYTQSGCTSTAWANDSERVAIWENAVGDTSGGNDKLFLCNETSNLHNFISSGCNGYLGAVEPDWGDCASAVTMTIPSSHVVCFYQNTGYSGNVVFRRTGPLVSGQVNMGTGSDQASSFRFRLGTSC